MHSSLGDRVRLHLKKTKKDRERREGGREGGKEREGKGREGKEE